MSAEPQAPRRALKKTVSTDSINAWLLGSMSRRSHFRKVFAIDQELRELPIGHAMRHLVRMAPTKWEGEAHAKPNGASNAPANARRPADEEAVEQLLARMLCAHGRPNDRNATSPSEELHDEGVEIIAKALDLSPGADAKLLWEASDVEPEFADHCLRGFLNLAVDRVRSSNWSNAISKERALELVEKMLCYHCAFQLQLIAARGWQLDHLPRVIERRRIIGVRKPFYEDAPETKYQGVIAWLMTNLTDPIEAIDDYHNKKMLREPNQTPIKNSKTLAKYIRAQIALSNAELLADMAADWPHMASYSADLGKSLEQLKGRLKKKRPNVSVHEFFFSISSLHALCFGAVRLVQLRSEAPSLVAAAYAGDHVKMPPRPTGLNAGRAERVDSISFIYRHLLLRDLPLRRKLAGAAQGQKLASMIAGLKSKGNSSSSSVVHEIFHRKRIRDRLERKAWPGHGQLTGAQRFDIIPEYFFRWDRVRLHQTDLLELANQKHEQDQKHRPPNAARASGKGHRKPTSAKR